MNQNTARGLFLAAIALAFGGGALLHFPIGTFSRAGAGLFPLMISSLLLLIAVAMLVRARLVPPVPMDFNFRNIALIMASLGGMALASLYLDMAVGIVVMVFISAFAGTTYSIKRNAIVSASLILVAFGFQQLLGLNLPLF
ncbi:tripartite tricarboxylate transporter TctB family protein [Aquincola tertiaricarbonis]|uniref:Tripartite tricarboxylate transporter TctB family protein n=1 Tax=Aquincola tertiaricarbonis TaxID=391953 RepID=A0ABY4S8Z4_AQUTE|nr:tripartite tricarboxylate transporter TctB family protein [Aquincola tertiaricarbonis]URI08522.1 tripartite tricarboxylate transporter TctB family protein [Aquincola tertiaricarbonis]